MTENFSHLDEQGKVRMVDIGWKPDTFRIAIAKGSVVMKPETLEMIQSLAIEKGDVLTTARLAGIMGAKRTAELIPLCHPLPLTHIEVEVLSRPELPGVEITASVRTYAKTGVEMEALTAVSIAALTVYDMAKAVDKQMCIQNIRLVEKHGGLSGDVKNI